MSSNINFYELKKLELPSLINVILYLVIIYLSADDHLQERKTLTALKVLLLFNIFTTRVWH